MTPPISLKPCPFCGDPMKINAAGFVVHRAMRNGCWIEPQVCKSVAEWNTRAATDEVQP